MIGVGVVRLASRWKSSGGDERFSAFLFAGDPLSASFLITCYGQYRQFWRILVTMLMRRAFARVSQFMLSLMLFLAPVLAVQSAQAQTPLPPLVFVARSRLATGDYLFPRDVGPAGHMITGITKFAPGSKLLIRDQSGQLRVLIDTARPAGDPL
ncbi:hypothetical protein, partial [Synechococcus sp. R6-5]|uniref:hypothetical protein n=1 Tax=Synechococcus sp. R6-5 TaxID=2421326 RepID=UPI0039C402D8